MTCIDEPFGADGEIVLTRSKNLKNRTSSVVVVVVVVVVYYA